jgi:uncharacterized protein YggE
MTVLALAAAQPLAAQQPEHRLITVTGESEVRVVPDEVVLTLGVQTSDHDLGIAKAENDRRVAAVLAAAEQHGVEREHLRTDYLQIEPRYRDRYEGVDFLGYWVQKTIVVRLSEIGEFENLLTAVLEAGANFVHGIDFRTTELRQHRDRARALALQAAAEKAEAMAAELDMELGRPRSIREDHFGWWSSYGAWWGRRAAGTMSQNVVQNIGSMPTQLEGPTTPGQLSVTARVTVSFEIE